MTEAGMGKNRTANADWHALPVDTALARFEVDRHLGLSTIEAQSRLAQHGTNSLAAHPRRPAWLRLLLQFHNPLIYVLLASAAATVILDDYVDAAVISMVVVINAMIGFIHEGKAEERWTPCAVCWLGARACCAMVSATR